jgi:hypothetical protein
MPISRRAREVPLRRLTLAKDRWNINGLDDRRTASIEGRLKLGRISPGVNEGLRREGAVFLGSFELIILSFELSDSDVTQN